MIQVRWLVIWVSAGWLSANTADGRDRRSGGIVEGSRTADVSHRESTGRLMHGSVGRSDGTPLAAGARIRWRFPMDSWFGGWFVTVAPEGTIYASDLSKLYALTPNGDLLWVVSLAGGRRPISVGADGTIYAAGNLIKAFNPDGTLKWQFVDPFGMGLLAGPNVGPDGNIYAVQDSNFGGVGGGLGAFSLDPDGNLLWADEGNAGTASTEGSNSAIVFGTDRFFVGINATNNTPTLWSFGLDGNLLWNGGNSDLGLNAWTFPKMDPSGRVIASKWSLSMQAITPGGNVDWVSLHPEGGSVRMPGIDSNGVIYTGSYGGMKLWAINPDGSTRWAIPPSTSLTDSLNVAPDGSIILVGGIDTFGQPGWARAYDTADGTFLWQVDLLSEGGINQYVCSQQPTFTPDSQTAYFATCFLGDVGHSYVYAIDTSGAPGGCLTDTDCDDSNPCTDDICDPVLGCQFVHNTDLCDDGDPCTTNDVCGSGACHGEPVNCDDGVACTTDSCDETTGLCEHDPDDALCDNGQFCDGVETCDPVLDCRGGDEPCRPTECDETADGCTGCQTAADCDDANTCTFDRCGDVCSNTAALYGDISGAQGVCGPDTLVDLSDILRVLDGFQGIFASGCDEYNIDIAGTGGTCGGDGSIDLTDILAVLDAFAGTSECAASCAAGGPAVLPPPMR